MSRTFPACTLLGFFREPHVIRFAQVRRLISLGAICGWRDGAGGLALAVRQEFKKHTLDFAFGSHDLDEATGVSANSGSQHQHAAEMFAARKFLGDEP